MNEKDGGPAFPLMNIYQPWNHDMDKYDGVVTEIDAPGMSLRDYFAAKVMQGMHGRDTYDEGQSTPQQRAHLAYLDADAMLAERGK